VAKNEKVALGRDIALSILNNTRSSQAKGPQQKHIEYKISAAVVDKDTTSCTSTSMQALHLDNQSWCVASYCATCRENPHFTEILPTKKYIIIEMYEIFLSCTSQISLQCTLNVEIYKFVFYIYVKACVQDVVYYVKYVNVVHE
jgi:hypothetical protein